MASRTPIVRQISWPMTIPQFVTIVVLVVIVPILLPSEPLTTSVAYGLFLYLLYSYGSRWLLLKSHREGIRLSQDKDYQRAIEKYRESYRFFSDHSWIDRYRALTMMTPSLASFREMALINIAFCYSQISDGANTKLFYQKALAEFPNSEMAKVGLNFIAAAETAAKDQT